MATLLSIVTAYEDNADYAETGSVAKARLFETACRRLLIKQPTEAKKSEQGPSVKFDLELIADELKRVREWLQLHPDTSDALANPSVIHPDFSNFYY